MKCKFLGLILFVGLLISLSFVMSEGEDNPVFYNQIDETEPLSFGKIYQNMGNCGGQYVQALIGYNYINDDISWVYTGDHLEFCYIPDDGNLMNQGDYEFGGMYVPGSVKNPATNDYSCPEEFIEEDFLAHNLAGQVTFCYRTKTGNGYGKWLFGGMYGTFYRLRNHAGDDDYIYLVYRNPATNAQSCPDGYDTHSLLSFPRSLFFCMMETPIIDNDGDGHIEDEDCDDNNPDVWRLYGGLYFDSDADDYGSGSSPDMCANETFPFGRASEGGDCDDNNNLANPGRSESCSTIYDDDCDGEENEGCVAGAYWYDLSGENIIEEADLNDWVMLKSQGLFVEGILKYVIQKNILGGWDIFGIFDRDVGEGESNSENYMLWKANESGEYFFRVGLRGEFEETSRRSDVNLEVSDAESDDSPIEVSINSPSCGINVTKGSLVSVVVEVSDADDLVRGNVSFGDGSEMVEIINGVTEINHTYNVRGDMQILVEVENDRGELKRAVTNIMVVDESIDGNYSAACITSPDNFGFYSQASIPFDARDSRGIIYTTSSGNYEIFGAEDNRLTFNWTINEGEDDEDMRNGPDFNLLFPTSGRKTVRLDVDIV
jgi:hypothetical protein